MPYSFRFGLSPIPPRRSAPGRTGPATLRVAKATTHSPSQNVGFVLGTPPRAANASLLPRTAIPQGIALFALSFSGSPTAEEQRAPTSCSPPRGVAANCAAQRAARARPKSEPYAPPVAARKPKARRTNFHTHHNPLPVPIKIVLVEAPSLDEHKIYTYIYNGTPRITESDPAI